MSDSLSPQPGTSFGEDFSVAEANFRKGVFESGYPSNKSGAVDIATPTSIAPESIVLTETSLQKAQRLYAAATAENSYDHLFNGDPEVDVAIDGLTKEDRQSFNRWMIDRAGSRTPNIWQVIGSAEKDESGNVRLRGEQITTFGEALKSFGFLTDQPTQQDIDQGIKHARQIVNNGNASLFLSDLDFMSMDEFKGIIANAKKTVVGWDYTTRLFVDSKQISGAGSMEDWTGRFHGHTKSYEKDGKSVNGPSIGAIEHYAALDTQLPALESHALRVILTGEGAKLYVSYGAHRTAAAKLRGGEPLGFSSLVIYDAR